MNNSGDVHYHCGASLISPHHAITAGSCVTGYVIVPFPCYYCGINNSLELSHYPYVFTEVIVFKIFFLMFSRIFLSPYYALSYIFSIS